MKRGLVVLAAVLAGCAAEVRNPSSPRVVEEVVREERQPNKLIERAQGFAQLGDLTRAAEYYATAIDEGANEEEVLPRLLEVYVQAGRYRVALSRAKEYLQRHPENERMHFFVATLHVAIEDPDPAVQHLRQVIELDPEHANAHYLLAVLLRDGRSDWVRADYHFRQYLELEPTGPHAAEARASLLKSVP